jgi:GMP synthase-like glutamine amidotransferase
MLAIIQNDPEVPPGIVETELQRLGVAFTVVHPYRGEKLPDYASISAVIVLGGAMGANDDAKHPFLIDLKEYIRVLVEREIPYLGICLGGQLLAAALGAEVAANRYPEQGTVSVTLTAEALGDRLFEGLGPDFVTFQWHNDSFSIPRRGVRLAFSAACPNQAFRVGSRAWGLQFHPEVDAGIVGNWSSWTVETAARTNDFLAAYRSSEAEYCTVSRKIVENFTAIATRHATSPTINSQGL